MTPQFKPVNKVLLDTFINENTLMQQRFNKFRQASTFINDINDVQPSEAIQLFNEDDLDLLKKGIKDEAVLLMHGVVPSEKNVQTLRWAMKKKFYASIEMNAAIESDSLTPYELGLIINKAFTPKLQKESPYIDYAETQLGYYDHYSTTIYKNDVAKFGHLYYDDDTMMAYHNLNLMKHFSKCGKEQSSNTERKKWDTLLSIKQELDILHAYEDYEMLPEMLDFIYLNNPVVFDELNLKFTRKQLSGMTGKTLCTLLITALEQKIETKPNFAPSNTDDIKADAFSEGYRRALEDLLNDGFEDLSGLQKSRLEEKLGRHSAIQYKVDNEILNEDKPKSEQIKIVLDGSLI